MRPLVLPRLPLPPLLRPHLRFRHGAPRLPRPGLRQGEKERDRKHFSIQKQDLEIGKGSENQFSCVQEGLTGFYTGN